MSSDGKDDSQKAGAQHAPGTTRPSIKPLSALAAEAEAETSTDDPDIANSETLAVPTPLRGEASIPVKLGRSMVSSETLQAVATPLERPNANKSNVVVRKGEDTATPKSPADAADAFFKDGQAPPLIGRTVAGRYTILELLGKGGMSRVYVARHELLKKTMALKVLKEELTGSKDARERFNREAIAAANIADPHIVDVTDYGFTEEGDAFIVMERLIGKDLRHTLRADGAFSCGRAVAITRQILSGLKAAHAQGIIHRDLKAENVFLIEREGNDFVKLLDFGISKLKETYADEHGPSLTSTGMVMGTPQYIAPEQAHAQADLDHRVDIYSLGVILYEMVTGELPFKGQTALELMMRHVQDPPEPPRKRRPDLEIPESVERVILKALSKDREDRYRSADDMLAALPRSDALSGGFESLLTEPPIEQKGNKRGVLLGGAVALVATAALAFVFMGGDNSAKDSDGRSQGTAVATPSATPDAEAAAPKSRLDARLEADQKSARDLKAADAKQVEVRKAKLQIASSHPKARIFVDGKRVGTGKVTLEREPGATVKVRLEAAGYRSVQRSLVIPKNGKTLSIKLLRKSKRPPKTKKPPAKQPRDILNNPYKN
jgi:serine/threonine protein kinase